MIKSQFIAKLTAKMMHLPEKLVADSMKLILNLMEDSLTKGQRIEIRGFGSFSIQNRAPRQAHNPKTGEKITTKIKRKIYFKPGKELRERVDRSRTKIPLQKD